MLLRLVRLHAFLREKGLSNGRNTATARPGVTQHLCCYMGVMSAGVSVEKTRFHSCPHCQCTMTTYDTRYDGFVCYYEQLGKHTLYISYLLHSPHWTFLSLSASPQVSLNPSSLLHSSLPVSLQVSDPRSRAQLAHGFFAPFVIQQPRSLHRSERGRAVVLFADRWMQPDAMSTVIVDTKTCCGVRLFLTLSSSHLRLDTNMPALPGLVYLERY
ncbi:uncharacterized protein K460DRAFT_79420 [Cucurbitaria berberidis CBS 394.84]|uniref:Uncharacterized protein n=1 Tax=Cucurbitaria berberidis CBS 394.84 TaxID=1168544 RepID=A0A9P4LC05_9PLEO|nr:uncharacterized protein K460DRAFT_79420 [Cucurbitaria berberidis CBS 394.84]KAF1848674.1 hypothetical protein K460DRAFT_79420 [Cucurbitaria berberidis CBS 394.84]